MTSYLITGASKGLGRGVAAELVRGNHSVWGIARDGEKMAELAVGLGDGDFRFSVCDVSRSREVAKAAEEMGRVGFIPDVVILNAGISGESAASFALEDVVRTIDTNLIGALAWVEIFLPLFLDRGSGQFVAISSLAAFRGDGRWVAYPASKAALSRSFESLRGRYAARGICFSTVHLGQVETGMGVTHSPLRLSTEQAVGKVIKAIGDRRDTITIPGILRLVIEMSRILPDQLFSRLVARGLGDNAGP